MSNEQNQHVPFFQSYDGTSDAALIAHWQQATVHRIHLTDALAIGDTPPLPLDSVQGILTQAVIIPHTQTHEGWLIQAVDMAWLEIVKLLTLNPELRYQIHWRKLEEIVAASYAKLGFEEVTLTPGSDDKGRDVIAVKKGFGTVRFIESVKAFRGDRLVKADDVRALVGVLLSDQKATKGIVTTTSDFAPKIAIDPHIQPHIPFRLELVNGIDLIERLKRLIAR